MILRSHTRRRALAAGISAMVSLMLFAGIQQTLPCYAQQVLITEPGGAAQTQTQQTQVQAGVQQDIVSFYPRNTLTIHAGVALPVGTFGQVVPVQSQSGYSSSSPYAGFINGTQTIDTRTYSAAMLGFSIGATYQYKFTPNLSVIGMLEGYYNMLNAVAAAKSNENTLQNLLSVSSGGSLYSVTSSGRNGTYINVFLLPGIRYEVPVAAGLSLYGYAAGGLGFNMLPSYGAELTFTAATAGIGGLSVSNRSEWNAAYAASLAGSFGLGAVIADRLTVGICYLTATPTFTQMGKTFAQVQVSGVLAGLGLSNTVLQRDVTANYFMPVQILSVSVGYVIGW